MKTMKIQIKYIDIVPKIVYRNIVCGTCGTLLLKYEGIKIGTIEVRCRHCKATNTYQFK